MSAAAPSLHLTDRVKLGLLRFIEAERLAPGDKLPPAEQLCQKFSVSRTVVREAIASLKAEGRVRSLRGSGVYVAEAGDIAGRVSMFMAAPQEIGDILDFMEFRIAVEVEAAGLAAARSSPAQEAEIEAQVERFADLIAQGQPTDEADFQFHMAIATATNNARFKAFLEHVGRRMIPRVKFKTMMGGVDPLPNRDHPILEEHREIADAILARDPEKAREAMRRHLVTGIKRYRALTVRRPAEERKNVD
jgi:DNA-binding FadR family transcriptional regulator